MVFHLGYDYTLEHGLVCDGGRLHVKKFLLLDNVFNSPMKSNAFIAVQSLRKRRRENKKEIGVATPKGAPLVLGRLWWRRLEKTTPPPNMGGGFSHSIMPLNGTSRGIHTIWQIHVLIISKAFNLTPLSYFDSEQGAMHFGALHRVFGANNVSKLLLRIPPHKLDGMICFIGAAIRCTIDNSHSFMSASFLKTRKILDKIDYRLGVLPPEGLFSEKYSLQKKLEEILAQEEVKWYQKS
ncbi:hypothetical protein Sjap_019908 [Stephania japonica]|uniref:Uncharacterized protein n=1 Tax=Stephania japonica TaxID=461633 RepID=A0AAP0F8L9_9MAGN